MDSHRTSPGLLQLALPLPLPRLFDYRPPAGSSACTGDIGRRVKVPFGKRELVGVVAAINTEQAPVPGLRDALAWLDEAPLLSGELWGSLHWLARYTHAPLGEVLATALPSLLRHGEPLPDTTTWAWQLTAAGRASMETLRTGSRPRQLAEFLTTPRDEDTLAHRFEGWRTPARALMKRGLAERIALPAPRNGDLAEGPILNPEQSAAITALREINGFATVLLDGITGSGKTEVYLQAIADCLKRGRQALVLVPEIGLTPQTLARFRARLGVPIHALHSSLSDTARARVWAAAQRGQARVIVGTRSAVFTPLPEAGLIVIDEEHDTSYKQQDGIRYHARDFALVRGKALDIPVLLGSATPSLESLHNANTGRYQHLRLHQRAGSATPPEVRILDIRKRPLDAGLSPELMAAIRAALDAGGQVLVFKNRRGYAPVLLCHDCGWSAHCPRCSTPEHPSPMTVHSAGRRLQCHHCGYRQPVPPACPDCASLALEPQGNGTERIEELLTTRFADVPVLRIDRSSTRRKDALEQHFAALGERPGILVGTQMLAKGHDLPNLTLACVVGIDEGLFSADFRSREKLAQLLIQVAGRAGRAERAGKVLLQTHHPDHPLLLTLIDGGYHVFAAEELRERAAASFPPFTHLALLRAQGPHAEPPMRFLTAAREHLRTALQNMRGPLHLHGPAPAPMPKRAGLYRAQLLLDAPRRGPLHIALAQVIPALHALPEARRVRWSLDIDPVDLY